ncbi:MAG: PLP-dependent aminotransferase family protein, partial [Bifidobacteriaceae bacterium]|nr:PLP-dependent aminotransferase family protein [Bifidobacteriaceae bacterium]
MPQAPPPTLSTRAAAATAPPWRGPPVPGAIALTGGVPWAGILPAAALGEAFKSVLDRPDAGFTALPYHHSEGTDELRAWIAAEQGADPAQVLVTNGALHSVALVLESLIDPGDLIVTEDPTYPLALGLFRHYGAQVAAVPVDAGGFDVNAFRDQLRGGLRPKLVYLIPDFQNPSGVTLTAERRAELLELADRYGFVVISDNPYRQL